MSSHRVQITTSMTYNSYRCGLQTTCPDHVVITILSTCSTCFSRRSSYLVLPVHWARVRHGLDILDKLYTKCISERRIPTTWTNAKIVIIFKKGNQKDIKNYRLICLLSNIYKLFTKILTARLERILDDNQPREQAGFRGG